MCHSSFFLCFIHLFILTRGISFVSRVPAMSLQNYLCCRNTLIYLVYISLSHFILLMRLMKLVPELQQGEPLCIFYSRYGICKFGPSCKFDHPMGIFTYNLSASSSADAPVRRFLGSSSATGALNLSSEGLVEAGSGRRLSLPETRQMSSGDDEIDTEG